jgi:site-specific recombinase XerC
MEAPALTHLGSKWPITGLCVGSSPGLTSNRFGGLPDIEPLHVAAYVKALEATASKPTVKQHLAAIRMLFDWLIVGQILAINPAHAVRGPKHVVKRGKTPVLNEDQARQLLDDWTRRRWRASGTGR